QQLGDLRMLLRRDRQGRGEGRRLDLTLPQDRLYDLELTGGGRTPEQAAAVHAGVEEGLDNVPVLPAQRPGQRRGAVERVLGVDVRLVLDEQLHDCEVPLVGGERQGGGTVGRLGVDVNALLQQRPHRGGVALAGRGPPACLV